MEWLADNRIAMPDLSDTVATPDGSDFRLSGGRSEAFVAVGHDRQSRRQTRSRTAEPSRCESTRRATSSVWCRSSPNSTVGSANSPRSPVARVTPARSSLRCAGALAPARSSHWPPTVSIRCPQPRRTRGSEETDLPAPTPTQLCDPLPPSRRPSAAPAADPRPRVADDDHGELLAPDYDGRARRSDAHPH